MGEVDLVTGPKMAAADAMSESEVPLVQRRVMDQRLFMFGVGKGDE